MDMHMDTPTAIVVERDGTYRGAVVEYIEMEIEDFLEALSEMFNGSPEDIEEYLMSVAHSASLQDLLCGNTESSYEIEGKEPEAFIASYQHGEGCNEVQGADACQMWIIKGSGVNFEDDEDKAMVAKWSNDDFGDDDLIEWSGQIAGPDRLLSHNAKLVAHIKEI